MMIIPKTDASEKLLIAMVLLVLVAPVALYFARAAACQRICASNGDRAKYEWFGGGCWCADSRGWYKPEDSRDNSRGDL